MSWSELYVMFGIPALLILMALGLAGWSGLDTGKTKLSAVPPSHPAALWLGSLDLSGPFSAPASVRTRRGPGHNEGKKK
jgi:hypothetical protein